LYLVHAQLNADFNANKNSGCLPVNIQFKDLSTGNPNSWEWDFGNGQTSKIQNPSATYTSPGIYTIKLTVHNSGGSSVKVKTGFIEVYSNPKADFKINKNVECINQPINFTDLSIKGNKGIISWYWDFGDGNKSILKNPVHSYNTGGHFNITLIVTDSNNCTDNKTLTGGVEIKEPKANFSANITKFCKATATANFTDLSTPSSVLTYLWDFGNSTSSTLKNPSVKYNYSGSFTVKLKVIDTYGCENTKTISNYITVDSLVADFETDRTDSCTPSTVNLTNKSFPTNGLTYNWDFGNQNTSNSKTPTVSYSKEGLYNISLIVSKGTCSTSKSKLIRIYPSPDATFRIDTLNHCQIPAKIVFSANYNSENTYLWNFGDSNQSTQSTASNTFQNFGVYTISLAVINKEGCKSEQKLNNIIQIKPPSFNVEINPDKGCKPLTVKYKIVDSSLVKLTDWLIQSGNGQIRKKMQDTITYFDTGVYNFTVTGYNLRGCSETETYKIYVGIPPQADFEDTKYKGCRNKSVLLKNLTNTHKPKADSFIWYFSDNTDASGEHVSHKFIDTGWMSVRLVAFKYGCPSQIEKQKMIYIYPPVAKIETKPLYCEEQLIKFKNKSIGGHLWWWDFGDTNTSVNKEPSNKYSAGTYNIVMIVTDTIYNCKDTARAKVIVSEAPKDDFYADKLFACPGTEISFTDTSTKDLYYFWTFNPNEYSQSKSPQYTYHKGGKYSVDLTITDTIGCQKTILKKDYIQISDIAPELIIDKLNGCLPLTVSLNDNSNSLFPVSKRTWFTGDGSVFNSFDSDTIYTYKKTNIFDLQKNGYQLSLNITDSIGCKAVASVKIVPSKPKTKINTKYLNTCNTTKIEFSAEINDTHIISPVSFKWLINNQVIGNTKSALLNIDTNTSFVIKLVFIDSIGCTDSISQKVNVKNKPLMADFSYNLITSANNCPPVIANFFNKSKAGNSPIKSFYWDFGNGSNSLKSNPSNTYSYPGSYTIKLIVEDELGCIDTFIKKDLVKVNGATGKFKVFPLKGCGSVCSKFIPETSPVVKYYWNFGDGGSSNDSLIEYTYKYGGKFHPVLVLEDSMGCLTQIFSNDTITVFNNPIVNFTTKNRLSCFGNKTRFINNTIYDQKIIKWEWTLHNKQIFNDYEPEYTYPDTGIFGVSLKAVDTEACYDSLFIPNVVKVYYDQTEPQKPYIYLTTHSSNPFLSEIMISSNQDSDFKNYSLFRTDIQSNIYSKKDSENDIKDTLLIDSIFNFPLPQCYYITSQDYCNNKSDKSELHCLINLNVNSKDSGNFLNWTPYTGWKNVAKYSIFRKENNNFQIIAETDGKTFTYLDTLVLCGENYTYLVQAIQSENSDLSSKSNIAGTISMKKMWPEPVEIRRVSVEDGNILIEWEKVNTNYNFSYLVYRQDENNLKIISQIPSIANSFTDSNVFPNEKSYIYRVRILHDKCHFIGKEGNIGKSILLKANLSDINHINSLTWNDYLYWNDGVNYYEIEYRSDESQSFSTVGKVSSDSNSVIHKINDFKSTHQYRVTAVRNHKQEVISHSNISGFTIVPSVFIPNSFSPNNDGHNDEFFPVCFGGKLIEMMIYDRWGTKIFHSIDENASWDGTFNSKQCPVSVYVYIIKFQTADETKAITGTISLLR